MKRFYTVLNLAMLSLQVLQSQTIYFPQWHKQWPSTSAFDFNEYIIDNNKNHLFLGDLNGSGAYDFDPGPSSYTLSSTGSIKAGVVFKLDSIGNFLWAKEFSANQNIYIKSLRVDNIDNVYLILGASSTGIIDVDPGPGTATVQIYSFSPEDIIVKLNKNGDYKWHLQLGFGFNTVYNDEIEFDKKGRLVVEGQVGGVVDLDPGPLTSTVTAGNYFAKYDTLKNFVWCRSLATNTISGGIMSWKFDSNNNFIMMGLYNNTSDFDFGPGTYTLNALKPSNYFVAKMDSALNIIWGTAFHSIAGSNINEINTDTMGNIFVWGVGPISSKFYPKYNDSTYFYTTTSGWSNYVIKYDKNGNYQKDIFLLNTIMYDSDIGIDGKFYFGGVQTGNTTDYDPGPGTYNLTGDALGDAAMAIYDNNFNFLYAYKYTNSPLPYQYQGGRHIKSMDSNSLFFFVAQDGNVNYGTPFNNYNINGVSTIALIKFKLQNLSVNVFENNDGRFLIIHPVPSTGPITISSSELITGIEIYNYMGQKVYSQYSDLRKENIIDLNFLSKGCYLVKIIINGELQYKKIILE